MKQNNFFMDDQAVSGFTSLSDLFMLLFIFLIAFGSLETLTSINVRLPEQAAGAGLNQDRETVFIEVDSKGTLRTRAGQTSIAQLAATAGPKQHWHLACDNKAPWGTVLTLVRLQQKQNGTVDFIIKNKGAR